jgi:hypothetical protein
LVYFNGKKLEEDLRVGQQIDKNEQIIVGVVNSEVNNLNENNRENKLIADKLKNDANYRE